MGICVFSLLLGVRLGETIISAPFLNVFKAQTYYFCIGFERASTFAFLVVPLLGRFTIMVEDRSTQYIEVIRNYNIFQ